MTEDRELRKREEMRPLEEAGQGEAEGFEQAEELLQENAENAEHSDFLEEGFPGEVESDESDAAYGEADEVDPTEVVRDPEEGDDDPGAGPGIAADR
jgi:hypothetical protein